MCPKTVVSSSYTKPCGKLYDVSFVQDSNGKAIGMEGTDLEELMEDHIHSRAQPIQLFASTKGSRRLVCSHI